MGWQLHELYHMQIISALLQTQLCQYLTHPTSNVRALKAGSKCKMSDDFCHCLTDSLCSKLHWDICSRDQLGSCWVYDFFWHINWCPGSYSREECCMLMPCPSAAVLWKTVHACINNTYTLENRLAPFLSTHMRLPTYFLLWICCQPVPNRYWPWWGRDRN